MTGKKPTAEGTVLLQLRRKAGWTQARLERTARLSRGVISLYETGRRSINRQLLLRLAATLGHTAEDLDLMLTASANSAPSFDAPPALTPASLLPHERQAVEAAAARAAARVRLGVGTRLIETRLRLEREEAAHLWDQLRQLPTLRDCRKRINKNSRFRTWALCELLCAESSRATARDASLSQGLAKLAVKVAEMVPGHETWQRRIQGYAWAFVAQSLRAGGDLLAAEQASLHTQEFWIGTSLEPTVLEESEVIGIVGTLRVEQERFDEARSLYDIAFRHTGSRRSRAVMGVNLAFLYGRLDEHESALEVLEGVKSLMTGIDHPHLRLALAQNRALSLVNLGDAGEALKELGRARRLSFYLGRLRMLQVDWLTAIFFAKMDDHERATHQLSKVWRAYAERNMLHQAVLVEKDALELGVPLEAPI